MAAMRDRRNLSPIRCVHALLAGIAGAVAIVSLFGTGCATSHTRDTYIFSRGPGARVWIAGQEVGVTPLRVELDFGPDAGPEHSIPIRVEKEGYRPQTRHVTFDGPAAVVFPLVKIEEEH